MNKLSELELNIYSAMYDRICSLNSYQAPGREHVVLFLGLSSTMAQSSLILNAILTAETTEDGTLTAQDFLKLMTSVTGILSPWERLALLHVGISDLVVVGRSEESQ
ncbi:uncharacterized protein LOC124359274 [Homalodisca vitripennis]|uniref:uncharacterized protein LOC124359274 n=1 Tax=Homalodisca vitripennis TaxID=197043 RepID=UPI001EEA63FF|nr:uncharacterized protein LOC124359274 [Homalodisca vitripennis]KAG8277200.1 hypothetical protein J6590_048132 [Homalodisca vitripennis]